MAELEAGETEPRVEPKPIEPEPTPFQAGVEAEAVAEPIYPEATEPNAAEPGAEPVPELVAVEPEPTKSDAGEQLSAKPVAELEARETEPGAEPKPVEPEPTPLQAGVEAEAVAEANAQPIRKSSRVGIVFDYSVVANGTAKNMRTQKAFSRHVCDAQPNTFEDVRACKRARSTVSNYRDLHMRGT